jgi:hypothetical protein
LEHLDGIPTVVPGCSRRCRSRGPVRDEVVHALAHLRSRLN